MAVREDKVTVEVDAEMIESARTQLGLESESDTAVVERALNAYLLGRLLDSVQSRSELSGQDADTIAYEELRAARRERGAAWSGSLSIRASTSRRSSGAAAPRRTSSCGR